ncbi:histone-lysine N-methyltransferase SETMAR [Trichonephila clavipes]|nr:histone-lysine N-methyltransferase SETMAR [Trichonephila clavipes]
MRNKEDILIKDLLLEEIAKELLEQREFLRNDAKRTSKPCSLKIERRITEEESFVIQRSFSLVESDKQQFRHILRFYYKKGKSAVQARKKLTDVYGEGVLTVRQSQNWFAKFRSGNFDVED